MTDSQVQLARLGFGTSMLAGRIGSKQSLYLLEAAYDAGIRYFDTAPMYGYGAAESVLGKFLFKKRHEVTVATKFGIEPPRRSLLLSMAKAAAKATLSVVPALRSKVAQRASAMVKRGNFDVPYATMSLARSLAALGTEHVDLLLMHEVALEQITPELIDFLEGACKSGQVLRYGPASNFQAIGNILSSGQYFGTAAQMPDKALAQANGSLPEHVLPITHTVFGETFKGLVKAIVQDSAIARQCSATLDLDCRDNSILGDLFLWTALKRNRNGVVVFSSLKPNRISRNASLLSQPGFSDRQVEALRGLLEVEGTKDRLQSQETVLLD